MIRCPTGRKRKRNKIFLPEEIINQILVRLPTKSLLRFSSVSKLWLSLISHSSFKNIHLKHLLSYNNNQQQKIMIVLDNRLPQFYLLDQDGKLVQRNYNFPFQAPEGIFVMGSCNGLLLVGIRRSGTIFDLVILWNPLFNNYKIIPFRNRSRLNLYGFDYDLYTQDYKFVNINIWKQEAEVYNLKSGLRKSLRFKLDLVLTNYGNPHYGRVFKGCIYWTARVEGDKRVVIIEFNVRYETFRIVNLPPEYRLLSTFGCVNLNIVVTKDCLGIFIYDNKGIYINLALMNKEENGGDISWNKVIFLESLGNMMNIEENGGGISWNKVIFLKSPGNIGWLYDICMVSNGEILMRLLDRFPAPGRTPTDDLVIYNPQKNTITNTGIHGVGDCACYISYMETLVLPSSVE